MRNRLNFTSLSPAGETRFTDDSPKVSICVPARNEEQNIERSIRSALNQKYEKVEVLVLDDHSTDDTGEILASLKQDQSISDRLVLLRGKPKPDDWLGKPWACQQLGEAADGDIIIFADADTWFDSDTAGRVVRTMGRDVLDMLTVWPRQVLGTFWEKMLIPLVYYALLSLLPVHYVFRSPRWMPPFLWDKFSPLFAAACGQFIAFKRAAYQEVGGHQSVKQKVVDDVELAKKIKLKSYSMRMYYGSQAISCRMYRSNSEIWQGFRKNFLAGFGNNLFLFGLMGLIHLIVYIIPPVLFIGALFSAATGILAWSASAIFLAFSHRFLMARWFAWSYWYGFLHPFSVLWFQVLGITAVKDYLTKTKTEWKGRPV
ncbi:glycosyltransferase family 2 protein [Aliifodinibius sp. S!AR15-10]|uniref:glycosyltransferase n=1 Tax=Aliifodinibius sp. S!AR15-10 TaxID=2950437 RepID=UPI0028620C6A|nr:glycosyltransferase family 2 protein [Aliifodinibius sp. S!AR15-10]MDR8391820.1 glycosyltransferase family 2 protein [Aliifodinibius sp. S!AR15-10]